MFNKAYNNDTRTFYTDMFNDKDTGKNLEIIENNNNYEKKKKFLKLKIAIISLALATGAKIGYDSYRISEGKETIMDEFNDYFECKVNNPDYTRAYVTIDNETYSIDDGIKNIIEGCRLNGMSDDEISVALLEYFPAGYVNDYLDTNIFKLRKTCIKRYKEER